MWHWEKMKVTKPCTNLQSVADCFFYFLNKTPICLICLHFNYIFRQKDITYSNLIWPFHFQPIKISPHWRYIWRWPIISKFNNNFFFRMFRLKTRYINIDWWVIHYHIRIEIMKTFFHIDKMWWWWHTIVVIVRSMLCSMVFFYYVDCSTKPIYPKW